ncbi:MAG: hypothetical protein SPG13_02175 [Peptostreptococcus porci]|uniref:hypothetical protein n=1 Tax=Peptostreptococcus porci TaxID=2652282 RepID=UPI002A75CFA1|nr:hypothetical protein [Peptostreptococcus porci]MDY2795433.1 hypothetical protein [Peptostreptococcus porci]MDY5479244.1 hypothetical protein [Peptostreptococcus porci]
MKNLLKNQTFKHLFFINLLYANPSYTSSLKKKHKYRYNPKLIYSDILKYSYILGTIIMVVVYTPIFIPINFSVLPFLLDYSLGFFLLMNILQTFTFFFNVFYESRDSESYMPLPIPEKMVFTAKMAVIGLATTQLSIPILPLVAVFNVYNGMNIVLSLIYGIFAFIIFGGAVIAINSLLMQFMVKTAILSKFKTSIITFMSLAGIFLNVFFIFKLQNYNSNISQEVLKKGKVVFGPISKLMANSVLQGIMLFVIAVVVIAVILFISKGSEKSFYNSVRLIQGNTKSGKNGKAKKRNISSSYNSDNENRKDGVVFDDEDTIRDSVTQTMGKKTFKKAKFGMFRYNLGLINDSTLITQSIVLPSFMPVMMIAPMMISNSAEITDVFRNNQIVFVLLIPLAIGLIVSIYPTNLCSVIVSLDRENYNYFMALPIDRRKYIFSKLQFSLLFTMLVPLIMMIGLFWYLKINIILSIVGILVLTVVTASASIHWLIFDYKNVLINWHSVNEIQNRLPRYVTILVFMILISMIIVSSALIYGVSLLGSSGGVIGIVIAILAVIVGFSIYRLRKFLKQII